MFTWVSKLFSFSEPEKKTVSSVSPPAEKSRRQLEGEKLPDGWLPSRESFETEDISKWGEYQISRFKNTLKFQKLFKILEDNNITVKKGQDLLDLFNMQNPSFKDILRKCLPLKLSKRGFILLVLQRNVQERHKKKMDFFFYNVLVKKVHSMETNWKEKHKNALANKKNNQKNSEIDPFAMKHDEYFRSRWKKSIAYEKECFELSDLNELETKYKTLLQCYIDERKENLLYDENEKQYFSIKFIISDTIPEEGYKWERLLRDALSKVVLKIGRYEQDFGWFHAALLIGNTYMHWTESQLVKVCEVGARNALCAIDFEEMGSELEFSQIDSVAKIIAKHVQKWNCKKIYSGVNTKELTEKELLDKRRRREYQTGNCQGFVNELLKRLGLKFSKIYQEYFDSLKSGKGRMKYKPSDAIKEHFKFEKNVYEFKSHSELDKFVCDIERKLKGSLRKYSYDYRILKSIDRSFWLRFMKIEEDVKEFKQMKQKYELFKQDPSVVNEEGAELIEYAMARAKEYMFENKKFIDMSSPLNHDSNSGVGCPFNDPRDSHSIRGRKKTKK